MDVGGRDEPAQGIANLRGDGDPAWLRQARQRGGLASINTASLPRRDMSEVLTDMREDRSVLPRPAEGG